MTYQQYKKTVRDFQREYWKEFPSVKRVEIIEGRLFQRALTEYRPKNRIEIDITELK